MFKLFKKMYSSAVRPSAPLPSAPQTLAMTSVATTLDESERLKVRGNQLLAQGMLDDATACYKQAVTIDPANIECLANLGYVLSELGCFQDAARYLMRLIQVAPLNVDGHFMLGMLFQRQGQRAQAAGYLEKTLTITHDDDIRYRTLLSLQRFEEAVAVCDHQLGNRPESIDIYINRGIAWLALDRNELALDDFKRALVGQPDNTNILLNIGTALLGLRRHHDALQVWERAIQIQPDLADAHCNESVCRLQLGDFKLGWEKYEWRWQTEQLKRTRRNFTQPLWLGEEPIHGKTILLHEEQGFGDTIQFCRYAQQVAERGASVVLMVPIALKKLLSNLTGVSRIVIPDEELPGFDYHCPLMSLPLALKVHLESMMSPVSYLQPDPIYVEKWRVRLGKKFKPRIGLIWSGNSSHKNDHKRSIAFKDLHKLVSVRGQFISVHKEIRPEDRLVLDAHPEVMRFENKLETFSDTAALLAQLDMVVTVDTSVAHLAGAMGKPVWILLANDADWRWFLERDDSPWYPSARLFRQRPDERQEEMVARVAGHLDDFFKGYPIVATVNASSNIASL